MAKVSVIIPVYNSEKYLKKCLDSVCNQTLSDIEIICVNDASTDNSPEILKQYDVKLISLNRNQGVSVARNIGIKNACGDYLGFVDADDIIAKDFYERLWEKSNNADVVKGNICNKDTNTILPFYDMNPRIKENKFYFYYGFTSAIYKTSFVRENDIYFPIGINYFEDPFFSIKTIIKAREVYIEDNARYYYSQNPGSLSKSFNIKSFEASLRLIMRELNQSSLAKEEYSVIYDFLYEFILEKLDFDLIQKILGFCIYSDLKEYYLNNTIKKVPNEMKPKFLLKRRELLYA